VWRWRIWRLIESTSSKATTFLFLSLHTTKALSNALTLVNCLYHDGTDLSSWKDTFMNLLNN
jgi:hypothetical protein